MTTSTEPTPAPVDTPEAAAREPHPLLPRYYTSRAAKRDFLRSIFDDTANDYDRVESWLSLGSGRWYRRQALRRAGVREGMHVLDVAAGTGLVAREALALVGPAGRVVGVDPSPEMLRRAREQLGISTIEARAERLPVPEASADVVSMGYALRHLDDLLVAFREFRRVLRPGGRVCVLEITRPTSAVGRAALRAYLGTLSGTLARVARLAPRTPALWSYYWETIDRCVPPERVLDALTAAGFSNVARHRSLGIFSEFTGTKTHPDPSPGPA